MTLLFSFSSPSCFCLAPPCQLVLLPWECFGCLLVNRQSSWSSRRQFQFPPVPLLVVAGIAATVDPSEHLLIIRPRRRLPY